MSSRTDNIPEIFMLSLAEAWDLLVNMPMLGSDLIALVVVGALAAYTKVLLGD